MRCDFHLHMSLSRDARVIDISRRASWTLESGSALRGSARPSDTRRHGRDEEGAWKVWKEREARPVGVCKLGHGRDEE